MGLLRDDGFVADTSDGREVCGAGAAPVLHRRIADGRVVGGVDGGAVPVKTVPVVVEFREPFSAEAVGFAWVGHRHLQEAFRCDGLQPFRPHDRAESCTGRAPALVVDDGGHE